MAETGKTPENDAKAEEEREKRLIDAGEQTIHEMRDAMATMMDASTKMMKAFIDMRLSYLKVMRAGLEDPQAAVNMMAKNMTDLADASKNLSRKD